MARTSRGRRWLLGTSAVLIGLAMLVTSLWLPYLLADRQYEKLLALKPATRGQLETALFFTRHHAISKAQSDWGRHTAFNGQFERYSILGEPIDVVYDGDHVLTILPSFE